MLNSKMRFKKLRRNMAAKGPRQHAAQDCPCLQFLGLEKGFDLGSQNGLVSWASHVRILSHNSSVFHHSSASVLVSDSLPVGLSACLSSFVSDHVSPTSWVFPFMFFPNWRCPVLVSAHPPLRLVLYLCSFLP